MLVIARVQCNVHKGYSLCWRSKSSEWRWRTASASIGVNHGDKDTEESRLMERRAMTLQVSAYHSSSRPASRRTANCSSDSAICILEVYATVRSNGAHCLACSKTPRYLGVKSVVSRGVVYCSDASATPCLAVAISDPSKFFHQVASPHKYHTTPIHGFLISRRGYHMLGTCTKKSPKEKIWRLQ